MGAVLAPQKGNPEVIDSNLVYDDSNAVIGKVQADLFNALDLLQNYQEGLINFENVDY